MDDDEYGQMTHADPAPFRSWSPGESSFQDLDHRAASWGTSRAGVAGIEDATHSSVLEAPEYWGTSALAARAIDPTHVTSTGVTRADYRAQNKRTSWSALRHAPRILVVLNGALIVLIAGLVAFLLANPRPTEAGGTSGNSARALVANSPSPMTTASPLPSTNYPQQCVKSLGGAYQPLGRTDLRITAGHLSCGFVDVVRNGVRAGARQHPAKSVFDVPKLHSNATGEDYTATCTRGVGSLLDCNGGSEVGAWRVVTYATD